MSVYLGIDWSEQKHDVCVMNESGAVIEFLSIRHTLDGFLQLDRAIAALGVPLQEVFLGLETAHTLLIDFFIERGYPHIYVLPPGRVKANQGRYSLSRAKDDQRDSWVMADMLRSERGRYQPWQPDSLLTRQIQAQVRYWLYLTAMIRRQCNHLRAVLLRYYPVAVELFSRLDSPIALAFLQAYPRPDQAHELSPEDFQAFLHQHHYTHASHWAELYAQLNAPQLTPQPDTVAIYEQQAQHLAAQLELFVREKPKALQTLQQLFQQHPAAGLFASLPGVGDFLAPALLAKLGDDRGRFPTPAVLQAVAGTCPITSRSGKHRSVLFRKACDHQFRYIVTLWADHLRKVTPWAQTYFDQLRSRGISHTDATRRLANRCLAILWKLWQTQTLYDEKVHLNQLIARAKPRS